MIPTGLDPVALEQVEEPLSAGLSGGLQPDPSPRDAVLRNGVISAALALFGSP